MESVLFKERAQTTKQISLAIDQGAKLKQMHTGSCSGEQSDRGAWGEAQELFHMKY